MAIIAITQHLGTRGELLGRTLAARLGYRFMNVQDIIDEASKTYHITPELLVIVDERRPPILTRHPLLIKSARQAGLATCVLIFLATGSLVYLFFSDNFSMAYVVAHSNRDLATFYKIAALWSGQEGSLLFLELPAGGLCFLRPDYLPE